MPKDTLWYTRCPVPTAWSLAVHLGWLDEEFEAEGIAFSSLLNSDDRRVRESHFDHTLPDSFRHGGNTPPLWARSVGNDVRLIGLSWTDQPQLLLALPESGIRSPKDLKGKRLSLPRRKNDTIDFWRAQALQFYDTALASAGLTLADVELVDLPIERRFIDGASEPSKDGSLWNASINKASQREEISALVRRQVDVIASGGPRALENQALLGAHVVYDLLQTPTRLGRTSNSFPYTLTVSGTLLEERPDLVVRTLIRVLDAAEWAKTHRSEVVRITARELGVAEEFVEQGLPDLADQLDVNLSVENIQALRRRKEFLLEHGFLPNHFDLDQWIAPEPLQQALLIRRSRGITAIKEPLSVGAA
jgi:ABC-type nitrate/sulfonate/bicarbonate transport system substrate-binding protein